jgi:ABC-type spermidine/putrescine transport system, permease component II
VILLGITILIISSLTRIVDIRKELVRWARTRSRSFYVLAAFFTAYVLFLYGPMFAIYILSFQGPDGGLTFPMNGVSLVWFGKVFSGSGIIDIGGGLQAFRSSSASSS